MKVGDKVLHIGFNTVGKIHHINDDTGVYLIEFDNPNRGWRSSEKSLAHPYTNLDPNKSYWKTFFGTLFLKEYEEVSNVNSISNSTTTPVNDHTCTSCKNTRCSKTEKSCWRCGEAITP